MNKISISFMKPNEAGETALLAKQIISPLRYYNIKARKNEIERYSSFNLLEKVKSDQYSIIVAKINNKIIGFCFSRFDDYTIWLEWFGVDSKYRHNGIARLLLKKLETTIKKRKAHKIWCDCRTSNTKSKTLLLSEGYKIICVVKNHWYGQDFILWHKLI